MLELAPPTLPAALSTRFRVEAMLASGGFGAVWRAQDRSGRAVALKVLHADTLADAQQVARFLQEAQAAALLKHPSIVPAVAHGVDDGLPWIAYELIEGESLRRRMDWKALTLEQALSFAKQLAGALAAAHRAGIIHRDVKPENVLVRGEDELLLTDFGIARFAGGRVKTQTGVILGTPLYMPLEILKGEAVTPAADVYAAGVLIYEMITRQMPVEGAAPLEILRNLLRGDPPRLSTRVAGISPALDELVARTLSGNPALRPQTGEDLERALEALDAPPEAVTRVRPPSRAGSRAMSRPDRPSRGAVTSRAIPAAPRQSPLALGWKPAVAILCLSGLSAGLFFSRRSGPAVVPVVEPAPSAQATGQRAQFLDVAHKIGEASSKGRDQEMKSLARFGLSLIAKVEPADRPVISPLVLGALLERLVDDLLPFAEPTRDYADNWLLVNEHVKRGNGEHHWMLMDPPKPPRVLTPRETAQLAEKVNVAMGWLPAAIATMLSSPAPLNEEGRLLRWLLRLHVNARGWAALPLVGVLESAFEKLAAQHPDHWVALALEARRQMRPGSAEGREVFLKSRERFEARHAAERAAGHLESDELCALVSLAAIHVSHRRGEQPDPRNDWRTQMEALRTHLRGPPAASPELMQSLTEDGLRQRWANSMGLGGLVREFGGGVYPGRRGGNRK